MQPQDNDFPIDQIKTDSSAAGVAGAASLPAAASGALMGGTTFQPQASPTQSAPAWQQDAQADASMLGAQASDQTLPVAPVAVPEIATPPSQPPYVPPIAATIEPSAPVQPGPLDMPMPEAATAPTSTIMPVEQLQPQPIAEPQPVLPSSPVASPPPVEDVPGGSLPPGMPMEPQPAMPPDSMPVSYNQPVTAPSELPPSYAQPGALPGADQLAPVAAGLDSMGSYGPPPKKSKKLLFIILGVVLGLALVGGGVYYFTVIAKKSTPTPAPAPTPTPVPTPTPTSGPATPPEGYATITKQCYSFALYVPNTVPKDETCTFATSTFGQKAISTIAVDTKTEPYQKIDEYLAISSASVTVLSTDVIKLDGLDATQVIYKATDGKTYSLVALLLVGKNYQQDGKTVTVVAITTTYQDEFDKTVTKNVLDTWRWQ